MKLSKNEIFNVSSIYDIIQNFQENSKNFK